MENLINLIVQLHILHSSSKFKLIKTSSVVKSLIVKVLNEEDTFKENLKNIIRLELKENLGVISQLVPEFKVLFGDIKSPVLLDRSDETQKRLFETLFTFFNCFTGDSTLIIVIDDLQWADSASFGMISIA
jgi:predicted ATPase